MTGFDWEKVNARELTLQRIAKARSIPTETRLSHKLRTLLADLILNLDSIIEALDPNRAPWLRNEERERSLRSLFIRRRKLCSALLHLDEQFRREFLALDQTYSDSWIEYSTAVVLAEPGSEA